MISDKNMRIIQKKTRKKNKSENNIISLPIHDAVVEPISKRLSERWSSGNNIAEYPITIPADVVTKIVPMLAYIYQNKAGRGKKNTKANSIKILSEPFGNIWSLQTFAEIENWNTYLSI